MLYDALYHLTNLAYVSVLTVANGLLWLVALTALYHVGRFLKRAVS